MGDLSGLVGMTCLSAFLVGLNLLAFGFATYLALKVNTVGAWILWAVAAFILTPASYYAGLSSYAWGVFFLLVIIVVLLIVILASVKACNNTGSCCTTDGRCKTGKGKKKGCFSNCCSSCNSCNSCDCNCDSDCDDDGCDTGKGKGGHRKHKPTHSGGNRVKYD